jgi:hypothetical protein
MSISPPPSSGETNVQFINVLSGVVAADETDCPDFGVCADSVDSRDSSVNDVEDTSGQTCDGGYIGDPPENL